MENDSDHERLPEQRLKRLEQWHIGRAPIRSRWLGLAVAVLAVFAVWTTLVAVGFRLTATPKGPAEQALDRAKAELRWLADHICQYQQDFGAPPTPLQGMLPAGKGRPDGPTVARHSGRDVYVDPWNEPYVYITDASAQTHQLYSTGPDRLDENGGGDDVSLAAP